MIWWVLVLYDHLNKDVAWDAYDQNIWKEHFPLMKFGVHGTCDLQCGLVIVIAQD